MGMNVKHLLGISGGKDSAALAIYLNQRHPELDIEYYTCDTGKELQETYDLITDWNPPSANPSNGTRVLKKEKPRLTICSITFWRHTESLVISLPVHQKMKLELFERNIGDEPTISYVGIRGDETEKGMFRTRKHPTIFPSGRTSERGRHQTAWERKTRCGRRRLRAATEGAALEKALTIVNTPLGLTFSMKQKVQALIDFNTLAFNHAIHAVLKTTDYPAGKLDNFPLLDNEDILVIDDIYNILETSGVGIPAYYLPMEYEVEVDGKLEKGTYSRSRSGCFFCFYQQKIEWVWLLEQHPALFEAAKEYEKDGYTWSEEPLADLEKPDRVKRIKEEHWKRMQRNKAKAAANVSWKDQVLDAEGQGCTSCFV